MSSVKRPFYETISSNSSNSVNTSLNDNNDNNDYIVNVVEEQHEAEEDMDIEHYFKEQISKPNDSFKNQQEIEEESRRKRLNTDKDTFISNPFPSTLNGNHYSSLRNTTSSSHPSSRNPFYKYPTFTNVTYHPLSDSNYISPRDSVNNNTFNSDRKRQTLN